MIKFNKDFKVKVISIIVVVSFLVTTNAYSDTLSTNPPPQHLRKQLDFNNKEKTSRYLCTMFAAAIHKSILGGHQGKNDEEILEAAISKYKLPNLKEVKRQGIQIETDKGRNIWISYEPGNIHIVVYKDGQVVEMPMGQKQTKEHLKATAIKLEQFFYIDKKASEQGIKALSVNERLQFFETIITLFDIVIDKSLFLNSPSNKYILDELNKRMEKNHHLNFSDTTRVVLIDLLRKDPFFEGFNKNREIIENSPKVLLIGPYGKRMFRGGAFMSPPLGVYRIASFLQQFGIDVEVLDPTLIGEEELFTNLKGKHYDFVGFSSIHTTAPDDIALLQRLRKAMPEALFIGGGIETSFFPTNYFKYASMDIGVQGFGEFSMIDMIFNYMKAGREGNEKNPSFNFKNIRGLFIKTNGLIKHTGFIHPVSQEEYQMLNMLQDYSIIPYERYWDRVKELYPPDHIKAMGTKAIYAIRLITSSHCPYFCGFCASCNFLREAITGKIGRKGAESAHQPILMLTPEQIVRLTERVKRDHPLVESIIYNDDHFFLNQRRITNIVDELEKSPVCRDKLRYLAQGRADTLYLKSEGRVNTELLKRMKRLGFDQVFLGVEHFSQKILDDMEKNIDLGILEEVIQGCIKEGITPILSLIIFYPTAKRKEIIDTINKTIRYIKLGARISLNRRVMYLHGSALAVQADASKTMEVIRENFVLPNGETFTHPTYIMPESGDIKAIAKEIPRLEDAKKKEIIKRYDWFGDLPQPVPELIFFACVFKLLGEDSSEIEAMIETTIKDVLELNQQRRAQYVDSIDRYIDESKEILEGRFGDYKVDKSKTLDEPEVLKETYLNLAHECLGSVEFDASKKAVILDELKEKVFKPGILDTYNQLFIRELIIQIIRIATATKNDFLLQRSSYLINEIYRGQNSQQALLNKVFVKRHVKRVIQLVALLAEELDMTDERKDLLLKAALLHDVGYLGMELGKSRFLFRVLKENDSLGPRDLVNCPEAEREKFRRTMAELVRGHGRELDDELWENLIRQVSHHTTAKQFLKKHQNLLQCLGLDDIDNPELMRIINDHPQPGRTQQQMDELYDLVLQVLYAADTFEASLNHQRWFSFYLDDSLSLEERIENVREKITEKMAFDILREKLRQGKISDRIYRAMLKLRENNKLTPIIQECKETECGYLSLRHREYSQRVRDADQPKAIVIFSEAILTDHQFKLDVMKHLDERFNQQFPLFIVIDKLPMGWNDEDFLKYTGLLTFAHRDKIKLISRGPFDLADPEAIYNKTRAEITEYFKEAYDRVVRNDDIFIIACEEKPLFSGSRQLICGRHSEGALYMAVETAANQGKIPDELRDEGLMGSVFSKMGSGNITLHKPITKISDEEKRYIISSDSLYHTGITIPGGCPHVGTNGARRVRFTIDIGGSVFKMAFVTVDESGKIIGTQKESVIYKMSKILAEDIKNKLIDVKSILTLVKQLVPFAIKIVREKGWTIDRAVVVGAPGAYQQDGTVYPGTVPNIPTLEDAPLYKVLQEVLGNQFEIDARHICNDGIVQGYAAVKQLVETKGVQEGKVIHIVPGTGFGVGAYRVSDGVVSVMDSPELQQFFDLIIRNATPGEKIVVEKDGKISVITAQGGEKLEIERLVTGKALVLLGSDALGRNVDGQEMDRLAMSDSQQEESQIARAIYVQMGSDLASFVAAVYKGGYEKGVLQHISKTEGVEYFLLDGILKYPAGRKILMKKTREHLDAMGLRHLKLIYLEEIYPEGGVPDLHFVGPNIYFHDMRKLASNELITETEAIMTMKDGNKDSMGPSEVAIIGVGKWARSAILPTLADPDKYAHLKRFHLVTGSNYSEIFAELQEDESKIVYPKGGLQEVLDNPSVTAVVISASFGSHYELVKKALMARKDVFVEKPFVATKEEALELVTLARANNCVLMVGYEFMYDPRFKALKETLDSGKLGQIQDVYINLLNRKYDINLIDKVTPTIVENLVTHQLSMLQLLFGNRELSDLRISEAEKDYISASFKYGDVRVAIESGINYFEESNLRNIEIVGSEKTVTLDYGVSKPSFKIRDRDGLLLKEDQPDYPQEQLMLGSYATPLQAEFDDFFASCANKSPPVSGGENSLHILKLTEALNRAYKAELERQASAKKQEVDRRRKEILKDVVFLAKSPALPADERDLLLSFSAQDLGYQGVIEKVEEVINYLSRKPYATAKEILTKLSLTKKELIVIYKIMQRSNFIQKLLKKSANYDYFNSVSYYMRSLTFEASFFVGLSCPYRCLFCETVISKDDGRRGQYRYEYKAKDKMSEKAIKNVLNDLVKMREQGKRVVVKITGGLEPLTDIKTTEFIINEARKRELPVKLFTNGFLLTTPRMRAIVLKATEVRISLSTPNASQFRDLYGFNGFSNLKERIDCLIAERNSSEDSTTIIEMHSVVASYAIDDMIRLAELAASIGFDYISFSPDYTHRFNEIEYFTIAQQIKRIHAMRKEGKLGKLRVEVAGSIFKENIFNSISVIENFSPEEMESMGRYKVFIDPAGEIIPFHEGAFPHGLSREDLRNNPFSLGRVDDTTGLIDILHGSIQRSPQKEIQHGKDFNPLEKILLLEMRRQRADSKEGFESGFPYYAQDLSSLDFPSKIWPKWSYDSLDTPLREGDSMLDIDINVNAYIPEGMIEDLVNDVAGFETHVGLFESTKYFIKDMQARGEFIEVTEIYAKEYAEKGNREMLKEGNDYNKIRRHYYYIRDKHGKIFYIIGGVHKGTALVEVLSWLKIKGVPRLTVSIRDFRIDYRELYKQTLEGKVEGIEGCMITRHIQDILKTMKEFDPKVEYENIGKEGFNCFIVNLPSGRKSLMIDLQDAYGDLITDVVDYVVDELDVHNIMFLGSCGGIADKIKEGDIVLYDKILDYDGKEEPEVPENRVDIETLRGVLKGTDSSIHRTPALNTPAVFVEKKSALEKWRASGAGFVEMELLHLARSLTGSKKDVKLEAIVVVTDICGSTKPTLKSKDKRENEWMWNMVRYIMYKDNKTTGDFDAKAVRGNVSKPTLKDVLKDDINIRSAI